MPEPGSIVLVVSSAILPEALARQTQTPRKVQSAPLPESGPIVRPKAAVQQCPSPLASFAPTLAPRKSPGGLHEMRPTCSLPRRPAAPSHCFLVPIVRVPTGPRGLSAGAIRSRAWCAEASNATQIRSAAQMRWAPNEAVHRTSSGPFGSAFSSAFEHANQRPPTWKLPAMSLLRSPCEARSGEGQRIGHHLLKQFAHCAEPDAREAPSRSREWKSCPIPTNVARRRYPRPLIG